MQNSSDEKLPTDAFVYIAGRKLKPVKLVLHQAMGEHHRFLVKLDYDALKGGYLNNPQELINLSGKHIDFEIQQGDDNANAYQFRGIITRVSHEAKEGKHGYLVLKGSSTTILLEKGKRRDVFTRMTLQQVFEDITGDVANSAFTTHCEPLYEDRISFLMQYDESDWEFLQRLSAISGETLYYTGRDLVFGQHKKWPVSELLYDHDLSEIQFVTNLIPNTFINYQYLPEKDETITRKSSPGVENGNEYIDAADARNLELVPVRPVYVPPLLEVEDTFALEEMTNRRKVSTAARSLYIKGTSKICTPRIGRILKVMMPEYISSVRELGTYRVVKVTHVFDQNNRYSCSFEGIAASLNHYPTPPLKQPNVSGVPARVVDNEDPQSMGRVRLEFHFGIDRHCDTWVRVLSPHGGGLTGWRNTEGEVERNRGFVAIPEIGDQVMVGFEYGDPNRPYVIGSLFHGKNSNGGGPANHIKSFITRSGHTIRFDDADQSMGIVIKDRCGNIIELDTVGQNIIVTTPENLTLNAKNLCLNASENISVTAGIDVDVEIGGKTNVTGQDEINTTTAAVMNMNVSEALQIKAKEITSESDTLNMEASTDAKITGRSNAILKGSVAHLTGNSNKLEMP